MNATALILAALDAQGARTGLAPQHARAIHEHDCRALTERTLSDAPISVVRDILSEILAAYTADHRFGRGSEASAG